MLKKLYCHTKPFNKDNICEPGNWYYYHQYRRTKHILTHFDIKEGDNILSKTLLSLNMNNITLFFWTKEQYRDNIIDKLFENKI